MFRFSPLDLVKVECLHQYTFYIDVFPLIIIVQNETKICANGPKLVLKDLC